VDVVFADAAGLPALNRAEALRDLFGAGGVPVTAPKSLTGRLFSGGGVLDVVAAVLSMRDGVIPPVFGTASPPDTTASTSSSASPARRRWRPHWSWPGAAGDSTPPSPPGVPRSPAQPDRRPTPGRGGELARNLPNDSYRDLLIEYACAGPALPAELVAAARGLQNA
jgi:hypothetical protein